jgi:hypothetical protein
MLPVGAQEVFSYTDDFSKLSSHMNKSSSMMMGGSMETLLDDGRGQSVGSHIRMNGKMIGITLLLDEVVTVRQPPLHKAWETVGQQHLLVIDRYRLGFDITERDKSSELRVFIDYDLPATPLSRGLGLMLGTFYAKWCVQQMVKDARNHFATLSHSSPQLSPPR